MPKFGKASLAKLSTCHPDLQRLFQEVVKHFDCSVLEGHRNKEAQDKAVAEGRSKTPWPTGNHNSLPSRAVDVMPYPVVFPQPGSSTYVKDLARLYAFVGFVKATAIQLGINIRVGADWDGDWDFKDQTFDDLPHFELTD